MGHEGTTAEFAVAGATPPGRAGRHGLVLVLVRAILLLAWVLIAINAATEARDATVADLEQDLTDGRVTAIQVERSDPDAPVQGNLGLRWDAGLVDSFAQYEYREISSVDEAGPVLDRARAAGVPVQVVLVGQYPPGESVTNEGWLTSTVGPVSAILSLLVIAGSLAALIGGRQPWLATKWAWFWLVWAIPVLWVAFLALEPRPLRLSVRLAAARLRPAPLLGDRDRRLTGGWAFVIASLLTSLLAATGMPMLSSWH